MRLCRIDGRVDSRSMWAAVRELTGRRQVDSSPNGITATSLNVHYAAISTDDSYIPPSLKQTATVPHYELILDWEIFRILDTLRPTATGLDQIPGWFLKIAAPVFCKPLANLLSLSIEISTEPNQWKAAYICPALKVFPPHSHADYRPISITPVLSRINDKNCSLSIVLTAMDQKQQKS